MKTGIIKQPALFLSIIILLCGGCGQKHSIEADIKGLGNDTLTIKIVPLFHPPASDAEILKDTVCSFNGKFSYEPRSADTLLLHIVPRKGIYKRLAHGEYHPSANTVLLLWSPNQKIGIKGVYTENSIDYEADGNEFNRNHSLVRRQLLKHLEQERLMEIKIDSMFYRKANRNVIDSLFRLRKKKSDEITGIELKYLLNNRETDLSGYYLSRQAFDTVAKYHDQLPDKVRNGLFKNRIDAKLKRYNEYVEMLKNKALIQPGNAALDFTLPAIDGDSLSLHSIDSKFTVLDFWGTWCGPCMSGLPKMKEYYAKYHKTVEIIGISCHDTENDWRKTVSERQLQWKHVINTSSNVSVKYGIDAYPTKIILDKDKKIIAVFKGEDVDFYNKLDELMK
jgi:thiol-disulfide isomerase/thioredoxin